MVTAGSSGRPASVQDVAEHTVRVLQRTVPPAIPGIMFLSGGSSEEDATVYLNAINNVSGPKPWSLSFSYGRALQNSTIKAWAGLASNVATAQKVFLERAKANSQAQLGKVRLILSYDPLTFYSTQADHRAVRRHSDCSRLTISTDLRHCHALP
jgi:fructose-bisphosphate aldolase class I